MVRAEKGAVDEFEPPENWNSGRSSSSREAAGPNPGGMSSSSSVEGSGMLGAEPRGCEGLDVKLEFILASFSWCLLVEKCCFFVPCLCSEDEFGDIVEVN